MNVICNDKIVSYSLSFFSKGNYSEFLHPQGDLAEEHKRIIGEEIYSVLVEFFKSNTEG